MPTYDVQPNSYAKGVGAGVLAAVVGGLLWAAFTYLFGVMPIISSLGAVAVGYGVGELISLSVNRKRGTGLAWIAGCGVMVAFLISWSISPFGLNILTILLIGFGIYIAVQKVR